MSINPEIPLRANTEAVRVSQDLYQSHKSTRFMHQTQKCLNRDQQCTADFNNHVELGIYGP